MEKKILDFMGKPCQKSKDKSKYVRENFQVVFKDVDETELLDASLRIVRSKKLSGRKDAFHLFLKELKVYEKISKITKGLLEQVLKEVGEDMNAKIFEALVRCLPSERKSFDTLIATWMKSSDDVSKIICAIDMIRKDLELRYETNKDLCLDIFKQICMFLRYKKTVLNRGALRKKKLRTHMKVKGVQVNGMKVDVSVVKVQSDGNVLVKYKQQGHDRMLNFVIEFVKDCDAVKTLGRKLVLFLEHEDKLKSAEKVWTRFRKELSEYESDFVKTIDFIHMKPLYWAIREREIGVLDGMIRRVPRMRDALRQAWNKMYENEDLDTVLKQFETKLQSLPNPRQHYCLPKHVRIECISDKETLLNAEKDILNSDILGVDAEWTNFMPKFNPDPTVSLLQLVTRDVAYLLIVPELETQTLRDVLRRIFTSSTLTTICFGGSEDVKRFVFFLSVLFLSVSLICTLTLTHSLTHTHTD